jgi:hypothetical protein
MAAQNAHQGGIFQNKGISSVELIFRKKTQRFSEPASSHFLLSTKIFQRFLSGFYKRLG